MTCPKVSTAKKVEFQFDLLVRAIWESEEEQVMAEVEAAKKKESEASHKKPTTDPQD
ncbi:MAG: hypothetical protein ACYC4D_04395 [Thermoleophilia bacterium]